jgi:dimeric dUTPase (all-alpha-NTP-PPase superfamily)
MRDFFIFLKLGFQHITDLQGYDHMLFIIALSAAFTIFEWKKVLILITFFTVGHSISLALAVLNIFNVNSNLIEFLIPLTIFITAINSLLVDNNTNEITKTTSRISYKSLYVVFFGLIHGLGFSNYLKSLLGKSESLVLELFSFNIGLELGQILILAFIFVIITLFLNNLQVKRRELTIAICCLVIGLTLPLIKEKWIF